MTVRTATVQYLFIFFNSEACWKKHTKEMTSVDVSNNALTSTNNLQGQRVSDLKMR